MRPRNAWDRSIPSSLWPAQDRRAWEKAGRAGDILEGGQGLAHSWRPQTVRNGERRYGRWLAYLVQCEKTPLLGSPASRVTPLAVRRYVAKLGETLAPESVVSLVVGLKEMMRVMAPREDWRWLMNVCNRLDRTAKPLHRNRANLRPTEEILKAATAELDRCSSAGLSSYALKRQYRDALMLGLMAVRPLRLKNFAALAIGSSVAKVGDKWLISIPGEETKTGREIGFTIPDYLVSYLDRYVQDVRPTLLKGYASDALWPGRRGGFLEHRSIHSQFIVIRRVLLACRSILTCCVTAQPRLWPCTRPRRR